jgi:putative phosphoribosyl transferase
VQGRERERFKDRTGAGASLARQLRNTHLEDVLVVGLPRGGVPVAAEVARALEAPLDVVIVRKIGLPWQPELALGAVGEGDVEVLNPEIAGLVSSEDLAELSSHAAAEVSRRVAAWRGSEPAHEVAGRTVVLVDDGIATGATARAAIGVLRARQVARIVLAVPVATKDALTRLRPLVDSVVCVREPEDLISVGAWYDDFRRVDDAEVRALVDDARRRERADTGAP